MWEPRDNLDLVLIVVRLITDSHIRHPRIAVLGLLITRIAVLGFEIQAAL